MDGCTLSKEKFLSDISPKLPHTPGCYMFLDNEDRVMYVGKSISLKKRVASYFSNKKQEKMNVMLHFAENIVTYETKTDVEALLLEHKLIKKHRPPYNSQMRKDYECWYINFGADILITKDAEISGFFIGPFSHKEVAIHALETIGKCFKLPTCDMPIKTRMCLRGHLKECFAPCENSGCILEYQEPAIQFLQGAHADVFESYMEKMHTAAEDMEFEKAAKIKSEYNELMYLTNLLANTAPILSKKQFVVFIKSRHEECFMLVYLNDGSCTAKIIIDDIDNLNASLYMFAKEVIISSKKIVINEENKNFVWALVEIGAVRRFYEVTTEFTCALTLTEFLLELKCWEMIK